MTRLRIWVIGASLLACGIADADRVASTGFYAETGLGAVNFLSPASKDAAVGPSVDMRLGYDLFSFLSVGLYAAASSHEATTPPPPTGQWFQLYRGGPDARLSGRINAIPLFAEGGVGAAMISSNILDKVKITKPGSDLSVSIHGGGGLEYQLENRHYGIGAAVDFFIEPQFHSLKALESRLYLRYTYGGG